MAAMPDNRHTQAAWAYHDATKHSYASIRANPHFLDFANQPVPSRFTPRWSCRVCPARCAKPGLPPFLPSPKAFHSRPTRRRTKGRRPNFCTFPPALLARKGIRAAKSIFALPPVPERSTRSSWVCGDLADLQAIATALGLPAKVVCGFVDATVNRLLDVDSQREVAFSIVALGHDSELSLQNAPRVSAELSPLGLETIPLSRHEVDYPLMREMHAVSSLYSPEEVATWHGRSPLTTFRHRPASSSNSSRSSDAEMPRDPIEQVILRRGSSRKFSRTPISLAQLSTMLHRATRGVPADFLDPVGFQLDQTYLIVHAVDQVRLALSLLAYNLGNLWRRLTLPKRIENSSLTSLQQRLVKTGGRLVKHDRYYWLLLAESHLTRRRFGAMLGRIALLQVPTG